MIFIPSALLAICFVLDLFRAHTLVLAVEPSNAAHQHNGPRSCKHLLYRKEWRALSDSEKKCYIEAVKCLQKRPARNASRPASWTRYDEFQAIHIKLAVDIHFVGQFLPWHRLFVKSYEAALRNECGYEGAQPYWNWSIDSDPPNLISKSPIWDPVTGFGGDGVPGTYIVPSDPTNTSSIIPETYHGCVKDGPFADYSLKIGPGLFVTEHCIARGVNDAMNVFTNSTVIANALSLPTFEQFRLALDGGGPPLGPNAGPPVLGPGGVPNLGPHGGGHGAIGGEMTNFFSSPADPLFYMHHANIDRIWWRWQEASNERIYQISGPTSVTPPYINVTLSFPLKMGDIGPTLPIWDVMDIRKDPSCYTYV